MIEKYLIEDDGAKIYYSIAGEKNLKLLLIHGWATDRSSYDKIIPYLSKRFTLIIPDLRGFGKSDKKPPFITLRMIKDMISLYKHENCNAIIGHSWGGLIAQGVSAFVKPKSTVILSSFAKWTGPFHGWFYKLILSHIRKSEKETVVARLLEIVYRTRYEYEDHSSIKEMLEKLDLDVLKESAEDILKFDNINNLKMIDNPTLIIHGNKDNIVSLKHAYYLKENTKNSELIIIPNSTHNLLNEKPKLISSIITGWIETFVNQ